MVPPRRSRIGKRPVRESLVSSSEEELPGETLGEARPSVEAPKSRCQGKRSVNRAPGRLLNDCSSKVWLRGAIPGRVLLLGKIRCGSSEEEPLWKIPVSVTRHGPSEERPLWETLVSVPRRESSEEEPLGEALKRASSEVKRLGRSMHRGGGSEEQPPWRTPQRTYPWSKLRRAATVRPVPDADSKKNPPRRAQQEKASPRLGGKQEKRAFRGLSLIRNPYILPAGVSRRLEPILS